MAEITGINLGGDTNVANSLQRQYDPKLIEMNNLDFGLFKRFKEWPNYKSVGSGFYFLLVPRDDEKGLSAEAEDSTIATPERPTYIQGYVVDKYYYATIRMTAQIAARARAGGGWITDYIANQIKRKRQQMYRYANERAVRNGDGVAATCVGAGSSSTSLTVNSTRHLHVGMYIQIYTAAGSGEITGTSTKITNINRQTKVCTIDDSSSWSNGSYIYRVGQYNSGTPLEGTGLRQMISSDTSANFQNVDPSTYLEFTSYHDSDGGAISREKLFKAINYAEMFGNSGVVNEIWVNRQTRNKLFMVIMPAIQYQGPKSLELAYNPKDDPISFEGKKFPVDECIFDGDMFGINWKTMGKITTKEIGLDSAIPQLKNTLLRDAGKDAVSLFLSWFYELMIGDRRSNFRISGVDTLYTF